MPLQLHPKAKAQVRDKLNASLPSIVVNNQMFIERSSAIDLFGADFSLPRTGKLHESLVQYLDEFPLFDFILHSLGQELWELDRYEAGKNLKLNEIEGHSDIAGLAGRLVDAFDSLPWTYRITIPLPEALEGLIPEGKDELIFSDTIGILKPTDTFKVQFPLHSSIKPRNNRMAGYSFGVLSLFNGETPAEWDSSRTFLQIAAAGFVDQYGTSGTAKQAERMVRSFFGLGLANRLFEYELRYTPSPVKAYAYVHRQSIGGEWEPITRFDLSDSVSRGMAGIKFAELQHVDSDDKRRGWKFWRAREIGTVFQMGRQSDQTVLSAQWLFDSYCGQDELLSFIQSMVVLEILFGDKKVSDEIGIGELISNRFAYLIGTTHEERAALIAAIKKIYAVRSQIVHSGKHRLTLDERALFSRLRWMCRRGIDKEIDLIVEASKKQKPAPERKQAGQ